MIHILQHLHATMGHNDLQQVAGNISVVAISLDYLPPEGFETMFGFLSIKSNSQTPQKLTLCQPSQWSGLGANHEQLFEQYGLGIMYCLNESDLSINKTMKSVDWLFMQIKLYNCIYFQSSTQQCNSSAGIDYLDREVSQLYVYVLDTGLHPESKQNSKPFINTDFKVFVSKQVTATGFISYSSYKIQTDVEFLPYKRLEPASGNMLGSTSKITKTLDSASTRSSYAKVVLTMDQDYYVYKAKYGKLDNVLSYVGGLFGILMSFMGFFLSSFNQYRYELRVAEDAFNFSDDGRKIKQSDFSFWMYIKYSIYDWINVLFCTKIKWHECNEIDEVREEINSQMEVNRFYKRIGNAESAISYAMRQEEKDMIKLLEDSSIKTVKNRRIKIQYYNKIIKGESALTVGDVQLQKKQKQKQNKLTNSPSQERMLELQNHQKKEKQQFSLSEALSKYPEIKQKAQSLKLSPQCLKIESQFSDSLFALNAEARSTFQKQIPLLIAYRFLMAEKEKQKKQVDQL